MSELRLARFHRTRDVAQRDELIARFMPLARSLAARYRHTSEPFDDLLQVASIGLVKAIERYDPGRGYAFSSFAVPTILGELRRHLRDHTWSLRVPRDLQELSQRLGPASDELARRLGREPTVAELANELGVEAETIIDAREALAAYTPASLDAPMTDGEDSAAMVEMLGNEDESFATVDDAVFLEHYLDRLSMRNREVLRLRFHEELKQREIGAILGVSQMHVSRLIRQSLEELRDVAAAEASATPRPSE